jgi:hypothetical protein
MEYFLRACATARSGRGLAASCTTSTRGAWYGQMIMLLWPVEAITALFWTWTRIKEACLCYSWFQASLWWKTSSSVSIPVIPSRFMRCSSKFQVDTTEYMHIHAVKTWTDIHKTNLSDTCRYCTGYTQGTYRYMHKHAYTYVICTVLSCMYFCMYAKCMCMYLQCICMYVHMCMYFAAKSAMRIDTCIYSKICTYMQYKIITCTTYAQHMHMHTCTSHRKSEIS